MKALNRLGKLNKITLIWVLSHQDIFGNKISDELAKFETQKDPVWLIVLLIVSLAV